MLGYLNTIDAEVYSIYYDQNYQKLEQHQAELQSRHSMKIENIQRWRIHKQQEQTNDPFGRPWYHIQQ